MSKITCKICGAQEHIIHTHLKAAHPEYTIERYQAEFPGEPVMSELAQKALDEKLAARAAAAAAPAGEVTMAAATSAALAEPPGASVTALIPKGQVVKKPLHEVFNLDGKNKENLSSRGEPIPISVLQAHERQEFVPEKSDNYVYDSSELKDVILALEINIPCLIWGHKGSGKSELVEQVCARTNRGMMRVQHSANTEESHVVGQWTVRNGNTEFELGPLPVAMLNGDVYCADEYDFGMPSVLAVYQAVLEGKPLIIKEAPADKRIIRPHKNFRFFATGNTNGSGDETGLYQGTLIQNSANYDRFGMVIQKRYMNKEAESLILQNHCKLTKTDADKMVEFATLIRQAYDGAKMSDTISPRGLINAARIGVLRGSFKHGLEKAFIGKLSKIDREVANGAAQRIFSS